MNGNLFAGSPPPAETAGEWFTAHCDGGSRGNPGPAGYGAIIEDAQGHVVARLSGYLGRQTNNYAEYSGLLAVLHWAIESGARRLRVVSDSELMVKQMQGRYKVQNSSLRPLWDEARRCAARLDGFEMIHTLRGGNREADRLASAAIDKGMGKASGGESGVGAAPRRSADAGKAAGPGAGRAAQAETQKPANQVLEGYVKNGVVHILDGELPDGIFVKITRG